VAGAAPGGGAGRRGGEVRGGEEQLAGDLPRVPQGQAPVRHRQLRGAAVRGHPARLGSVPHVQQEGVPELRHLLQAQSRRGTPQLRPHRPRRCRSGSLSLALPSFLLSLPVSCFSLFSCDFAWSVVIELLLATIHVRSIN
jgi:hypothetical protein